MKTSILIIIGIISVILFVPSLSYGLWVKQPLEELWAQSQTIFVGTITEVNVLEFERSNIYTVEENGASRIIIENYTQTLDEYTVNIEEFLKNPQESSTITMLEATVGGVPGRSVSIGGFELGDRVLFYVPKIDGTNQYSPESQIIRTDNELFYFQDEFKKFASAKNIPPISPLKQFKDGIDPRVIHCNDKLVLIQKRDDTPACVKEKSVIPLMIRKWAKISEFKVTSGFLPHEIENGQVLSMNFTNDECSPSIIIKINSEDDGHLVISIPRIMVDPKDGNEDDRFYVIVDGKEVDFKESASDMTKRTLDIPFSNGTKNIEVIEACLI